ncbi:MAG: type II secretion system F family protein [Thermoleophilia bacterium]|jgi:type IV pilus assembly protein PilC
MATFSYMAIDENGKTVNGTLDAESIEKAQNIILTRGQIPTSVKEAGGANQGSSFFSKISENLGQVKTGDLIIFTKQFRSMMTAGVPIIRLLQVLEKQTENAILRGVANGVGKDILAGMSLYEAMKRHPAVFSPLYLSMIHAGETSGTVPDIMTRLINIIEHEAKIKSDIKSALQYPLMVVITMVIAFFILLTFVIPKFVTIFNKVGLALPLPTKIAMLLYRGISDYWYILIASTIGLVIVLRLYLKTPPGRYTKDRFILKLPIFGKLFQKAAMSRFASIFAILHASGIPVLDSLAILSETINNAAISREFDKILERIREGQGISEPLGKARYFTPMVVDMVAIGEESGNMEEMLRQVSLHYDDEVAYAVKGLSDMIGPVLIVGLAVIVGFFALAIFLPMWDLTKMAK